MYGYGYRYNSGLVLGAGGGAPFVNTYSLAFDGIDDKVSIGTALDLGINSTLSFWIKRGRISTSEVWFGEDSYSSDYLVTITSSTVLYFRINTSYVGWNYPAVKTIFNNTTEWVNVCIVRSGNSVELFLNGISYGTGNSNAGTPGATVTRFDTIGASPYGLHTLAQFDEIAAWNNNTVNPVDIYNLGTPTDLNLLPTPPLNWYRMGDNGSWKSPQWLIPNNENKDKLSNYSMDFDGVDDYVNLGDSDDFSFGDGATDSPFSISAWIKMDDSSGFRIFNKYSGSANEYQFGMGGAQKLQMYIFDNTSSFKYRARVYNTILNTGQWYHVATTYSGVGGTNAQDGIKIYVDGVRVDDSTVSSGAYVAMGNKTTPVYIGKLDSSYSNGKIDEVSVFNSELSQSDITDIYNGGQPTTISGAIAHYKMGEDATFSGGVWTVPDAVGSNNGTSNAMTIEDRVGDAPNSENNALSYNMDEVDRVTDTP